MNTAEIVTLITNVGFPIACCVALFWYMVNQNEKHKSEIDELTNTINNNTKVLAELTTLIKHLLK